MQAASNDVVGVICNMLDGRSLASFAQVDRRNARLVPQAHASWRHLLRTRFPKVDAKTTSTPYEVFAEEWAWEQQLYASRRSCVIYRRAHQDQEQRMHLALEITRAFLVVVWPCMYATAWFVSAWRIYESQSLTLATLWLAMLSSVGGGFFSYILPAFHSGSLRRLISHGYLISGMDEAISTLLLFGSVASWWPIWLVPLPWVCSDWWSLYSHPLRDGSWAGVIAIRLVMWLPLVFLSFYLQCTWGRLCMVGVAGIIIWLRTPKWNTSENSILIVSLVWCSAVWVMWPDRWLAHASIAAIGWSLVWLIVSHYRLAHIQQYSRMGVIRAQWNNLASTSYLAGDDLPRCIEE
jgi:hypothetical protein